MCDWSQVNLAVDAENELEAEERRVFTWLTMNDRGEYRIDNLELFVAVILRIHAKNSTVAPNLFVNKICCGPSNKDGYWVCAVRKAYGNRGVSLSVLNSNSNLQNAVRYILDLADVK